jgi:hypothetical protein
MINEKGITMRMKQIPAIVLAGLLTISWGEACLATGFLGRLRGFSSGVTSSLKYAWNNVRGFKPTLAVGSLCAGYWGWTKYRQQANALEGDLILGDKSTTWGRLGNPALSDTSFASQLRRGTPLVEVRMTSRDRQGDNPPPIGLPHMASAGVIRDPQQYLQQMQEILLRAGVGNAKKAAAIWHKEVMEKWEKEFGGTYWAGMPDMWGKVKPDPKGERSPNWGGKGNHPKVPNGCEVTTYIPMEHIANLLPGQDLAFTQCHKVLDHGQAVKLKVGKATQQIVQKIYADYQAATSRAGRKAVAPVQQAQPAESAEQEKPAQQADEQS